MHPAIEKVAAAFEAEGKRVEYVAPDVGPGEGHTGGTMRVSSPPRPAWLVVGARVIYRALKPPATVEALDDNGWAVILRVDGRPNERTAIGYGQETELQLAEPEPLSAPPPWRVSPIGQEDYAETVVKAMGDFEIRRQEREAKASGGTMRVLDDVAITEIAAGAVLIRSGSGDDGAATVQRDNIANVGRALLNMARVDDASVCSWCGAPWVLEHACPALRSARTAREDEIRRRNGVTDDGPDEVLGTCVVCGAKRVDEQHRCAAEPEPLTDQQAAPETADPEHDRRCSWCGGERTTGHRCPGLDDARRRARESFARTKAKASPQYASLRRVLDAALEQASTGKGKERHARDGQPFEEQPIVADLVAMETTAPALFQARKKLLESARLDVQHAKHELLGAINYAAAAWIYLDGLEDQTGKETP